MNKKLVNLFICLGLLLPVACSLNSKQRSVPIGSVRNERPNGIKEELLTISRSKLLAAISKKAPINDIRLVSLYGGGEAASTPEYRLFDVNPESAYYLIGLRNTDVLVAAHEFVIYIPEKFAEFVSQYLPYLDSSSVEIRRAGNPIVFKYSFVD